MFGDESAIAGFLPRDDLGDDHRHARRDALVRGRSASLADDEMARKHQRGDTIGPAEHFSTAVDRPFNGFLEGSILAHSDGELESEG